MAFQVSERWMRRLDGRLERVEVWEECADDATVPTNERPLSHNDCLLTHFGCTCIDDGYETTSACGELWWGRSESESDVRVPV